jgi:hypothetical protein
MSAFLTCVEEGRLSFGFAFAIKTNAQAACGSLMHGILLGMLIAYMEGEARRAWEKIQSLLIGEMW